MKLLAKYIIKYAHMQNIIKRTAETMQSTNASNRCSTLGNVMNEIKLCNVHNTSHTSYEALLEPLSKSQSKFITFDKIDEKSIT